MEVLSTTSASEANLVDAGRVVRGYHGTTLDAAVTILEDQAIQPSRNSYDWLGWGAYFWEAGLHRAWIWAERRYGGNAAVVSVDIRLGRCLDLLDGRQHPLLKAAHELIRREYERQNLTLPVNTPTQHPLDCLVLNYFCDTLYEDVASVRAPFEDGEPVYPGSRFTSQAHVQICVKDPSCYVSRFRIDEHG